MQSVHARHAVVSSLADQYYERVMCFARQLVEPDVAEDITQEVFLRLSKLEGVETREISISYLLKIAHNLARARRRTQIRASEAQHRIRERAVAQAEAKRAIVVDREQEHRLRELMHRLTPNEQQAIHLTVCCGLSLREASEALGVRVSTVTNWKYRGLQKLADANTTLAA